MKTLLKGLASEILECWKVNSLAMSWLVSHKKTSVVGFIRVEVRVRVTEEKNGTIVF